MYVCRHTEHAGRVGEDGSRISSDGLGKEVMRSHDPICNAAKRSCVSLRRRGDKGSEDRSQGGKEQVGHEGA